MPLKKQSRQGTERRYFAGIYFLFRIIVFLIFTVVGSIQKRYTILQATYTTYIVFIVVFVILRPYKKDRYNILDVTFLLVLAITSTTYSSILVHPPVHVQDFSEWPVLLHLCSTPHNHAHCTQQATLYTHSIWIRTHMHLN